MWIHPVPAGIHKCLLRGPQRFVSYSTYIFVFQVHTLDILAKGGDTVHL